MARSTKLMSVGRFGMCIHCLIMRKRNRVRKIGIMNIFFTKSTVSTQLKTFGACTIIFTKSKK